MSYPNPYSAYPIQSEANRKKIIFLMTSIVVVILVIAGVLSYLLLADDPIIPWGNGDQNNTDNNISVENPGILSLQFTQISNQAKANDTFTVNAEVTCTGGDCGEVDVALKLQ
jgi:flagellar basal body-associated protein FliL